MDGNRKTVVCIYLIYVPVDMLSLDQLKNVEDELKAMRAKAADRALQKEKAKEDKQAAKQAKKDEMKKKADEEKEKRKVVCYLNIC